MRVVVVDDHPAFRKAARQLLERSGYVVVGEAGCAAAAHEAVARLSPDAVLLDVRLGDENGLAVSQALTRAYPTLAVLLISAEEHYAQNARARASGARGIVHKSELPALDLSEFWPASDSHAKQIATSAPVPLHDAGTQPTEAPASGTIQRMSMGRDERAHARDVAAARRDADAAVRDGLDDEATMSERELAGRKAARVDREASLTDRLAAAEDRLAAADARNAAKRSGE